MPLGIPLKPQSCLPHSGLLGPTTAPEALSWNATSSKRGLVRVLYAEPQRTLNLPHPVLDRHSNTQTLIAQCNRRLTQFGFCVTHLSSNQSGAPALLWVLDILQEPTFTTLSSNTILIRLSFVNQNLPGDAPKPREIFPVALSGLLREQCV